MTTSLFGALADPVRRQILVLLADGEQPVGALVDAIAAGRPISQPAISQHLKVLREAGIVAVRTVGTRRLYALEVAALEQAAAWLRHLIERRGPFDQPLDALETEVARGRRRLNAASAVSPICADG